MRRILYPPLIALALLSLLNPATADESKELRKQRQAAQKERQTQKSERSKEISEGTKDFREYVRNLTMDYQEQVKELDTEFKLQRVELKADHDARVAGAEAEYQKKLSSLFMRPGVEFNDQAIEQMQADGKAFADELFALKKQSAEELHREQIAKEERENALLSEVDRMALDEASSLGLTGKYSPILATPIGDGLTKEEERWNERERKEVVKLEDRNKKTISKFRNGEKLRKWEIGNLNEDFKLTWDEKAELHALDSQQLFYNAMFMQAAQGGQVDQQKLMAEMAEINEKKKLIKIEYRKVRDKNRITRREEKKAILKN
ncbi:MAG: hypothetical protein GWP69_18270 [Gammaproteobacteria bacterium]|jgi:hypothetical protein|nr:hypothetical protein [Gammaproteobacteria bacterium]NCF80542.1 hypothetical protein [Pseudomonadota bacterium]